MDVLKTPAGRQGLRLAFFVSGIVCSLLVYGVLQERIMTQPYGAEEEHFKYSVFLVLNNRLVSMSIAACVLAWKRLGVAPVAPLPAYAAVSLSNVIATTCQYEALRYVSFPVQTLGKCGKMIPVMIWGRIIMGRRYGPSDYAVAAAVTAGATIFLLGGEVTSSASKHHGKSAGETSMYGLMLMGGYLGFDGFTSTFQDKLFKGYAMETYNQMLWVTACSACLSAAWLLGDSTMGDALAFVSRHPEALQGIFALSLSSAIGQLFILNTIREFGALTFATVMTSRQFLSILLSCVLFMHPLTGAQWLGTASIFGALYYQAFVKSKSHSKKGGAASEGAAEMPPVKPADEGPILPLTTRDSAPGGGDAGGFK